MVGEVGLSKPKVGANFYLFKTDFNKFRRYSFTSKLGKIQKCSGLRSLLGQNPGFHFQMAQLNVSSV